MVNLDIYTDPSRDAVQALRSNIVEVEVEVVLYQLIPILEMTQKERKGAIRIVSSCELVRY